MGLGVAQKILKNHMLSGSLEKGAELALKIDQTLTQDSTGTMAYLQFEALGIDRVKTKKSVAYIDHNMLQAGFENADDHKYIQTVANKYGVAFSRPGNGVCHQVHIERFAVPGQTLLGSDSHTPTCGGLGMIAIGAGGLDVACAMGGGAYYITAPAITNVVLSGKLPEWVSAKDIILEILRVMTVKGGVGKIIEYSGPALKDLTIPERATITNMGAELGATTSIFPSDEMTRAFLKAQGREEAFVEILPDADAHYDERIEIDLSTLVPLIAKPHSPDNVVPVSEVSGIKVDQVTIGSCTNSSFTDMMKVAQILKGKTVHPDVSLVIGPGSKQVLNMIAANGALADMIAAGARILESGCGPCIGMGQAPRSNAVSLRTINRNFMGRSGTKSAQVYLVSPEVAAVSALSGFITDPRETGTAPRAEMPDAFLANDNMVIEAAPDGSELEVVRGPNIKPFPVNQGIGEQLQGKALIKVEDNITTDHIMPSNAQLLPYRSNIPYLADFCLTPCDAEFPTRAKREGGGFIIAGSNYGQGSSREHAALAPLQLGIKAVMALSFARIHEANLINNGIWPLTFKDPQTYAEIEQGDELVIERAAEQLAETANSGEVVVKNLSKNKSFTCLLCLTDRQRAILAKGGLLNFTAEISA